MTILLSLFILVIILFFFRGNAQISNFIKLILQMKSINPTYLDRKSFIKKNKKNCKFKNMKNENVNIFKKIKKLKKEKTKEECPPKRSKIKLTKNNPKLQDSSQKPINNFLLNIQLINPKNGKEKNNNVYSKNNKEFKRKTMKNNSIKSKSEKSNSLSELYKRDLNNKSNKIFNKKKQIKNNNKIKDHFFHN